MKLPAATTVTTTTTSAFTGMIQKCLLECIVICFPG